jgi:hypothetical protein
MDAVLVVGGLIVLIAMIGVGVALMRNARAEPAARATGRAPDRSEEAAVHDELRPAASHPLAGQAPQQQG